MPNKTQEFSLSIGQEQQLPELVIEDSALDNALNFPVIYAPITIIAEDYQIPKRESDLAWYNFLRREQVEGYDSHPTASQLENEVLDQIDANNSVTYFRFNDADYNDEGVSAEYETDKLRIIRFGIHHFRVYSSLEFEHLDGTICTNRQFKKVDLISLQKMICLGRSGLGELEVLDTEKYQYPKRDANDPDKPADLFNIQREGSVQQGRFNQDNIRDGCDFASYEQIIAFLGKQFRRTYNVPSNSEQRGTEQTVKLGLKYDTYRETLGFNNDTEKTIRFAYGEPEIAINYYTLFINTSGRIIDIPTNDPEYWSCADSKTLEDGTQIQWCGKPKRLKKPGNTFYAKEPCSGDLIVEYTTPYVLWKVLYDIPDPSLKFEVHAGTIETVGYRVYTEDGELIEYSVDVDAYKEEQYYGLLKQGSADALTKIHINSRYNDFAVITETEENPKQITHSSSNPETPGDPIIFLEKYTNRETLDQLIVVAHETSGLSLVTSDQPEYQNYSIYTDIKAVKLFKRAQIKDFKTEPIEIYVTNTFRTARYSFTPEAITLTAAETELPKVTISKTYERTTVYPNLDDLNNYVEVNKTIELVNIDIHGNVSTENVVR